LFYKKHPASKIVDRFLIIQRYHRSDRDTFVITPQPQVSPDVLGSQVLEQWDISCQSDRTNRPIRAANHHKYPAHYQFPNQSQEAIPFFRFLLKASPQAKVDTSHRLACILLEIDDP